ncbi:hypothetical protein JCM10908_003945 [Rhodotorula pacifica]|uniref:GPI anchored serine-threonine rich family protein n=1 Tax=Rhodotorula pacifica TaxID=1495444 RepID=UPI00317FEF6E
MLSVTQLGASAVLLALSAAKAVHADVVPTAPGPGEVFRVGQKCNIQWNLDTTGTWTSFEIQLMTGSNLNMVPLTTVATGIDGTTGAGTIDFTCPQVTPNADIYFYQFTQAGAATSWTTRFTIAAADGTVTQPTETTAGIAWGTGQLVGAAGAGAGAAAAGSSSSATGAAASTTLATTRSRVVAAASSSTSLAAARTTTTTTSSSMVTSIVFSSSSSSSSTTSSAPAAAASGTLTSLSPAAAVITVTSSSSSAPSSSARSNGNAQSAAGRVGASVGAAVAAGVVAVSYALLA